MSMNFSSKTVLHSLAMEPILQILH